jgi:hypothetical protein
MVWVSRAAGGTPETTRHEGKEHSMRNLTLDRFADLKGAEVRSSDGEKIGTVDEVFYDGTTREPEWIGLGTGFLGMKKAVVPVAGATVEGDLVCVPYDKDVVKKEPPFDEQDGVLTDDSERRLCDYFGMTGHQTMPHRLNRYDFGTFV